MLSLEKVKEELNKWNFSYKNNIKYCNFSN